MWDFIVRYWLEFVFGIIVAALSAAYGHLAKKFKAERAKNEVPHCFSPPLLFCDIEVRINLPQLFALFFRLMRNVDSVKLCRSR